MVLLNVALMWAMPRLTLRRCLRFLLLAMSVGVQWLVFDGTDASHWSHQPGLPAHFLDALLGRDRLARPLAGAGVGLGALAADRQAAAVPEAAVALDLLEAVDVLVYLAAQRAFDGVLAVEDGRDAG